MFLAVYGDDALRVREFSEDLLEKFVVKYDPSRLNTEVFDFSLISRETLLSSLQASPFLAEKRFIFLKNVAESLKKADVAFWTDFFSRLDESTSVCFVDVLDEVKWKKSHLGIWFVSLSEDRGKRFPLHPLSSQEYVAWIRARARTYGLDMPEHIARVLFERVGGVSQELALEVQKIAAFAASSPLSEEMVEKLVPRRTSSDFFSFLDLLPLADPHELLRALKKEEDTGSDSFALYGGLLRQARIFSSVVSLVEAGIVDQREIAKILGLHPFVAQKAFGGVRFFSSSALRSVLCCAISWDSLIKTGISAEVLTRRLLDALILARKNPVS